MIRLAREAIATIRDEAARAFPDEACGILVGRPGEPAESGTLVIRAVAVRNERSDDRHRRYHIGPDAVRAAEAAAVRDGLDLVGFFHSHPGGGAEPSAHDLEGAWPWYAYLIVPVRDGVPAAPRVWRLADDRASFLEQAITIEHDATP